MFSDPGVALASRSSSSGGVPRLGAMEPTTVPVVLPGGDRLVDPAGLCGASSEPPGPPETDVGNEGENIFEILESEPILGKPEDTVELPVSTLRHLPGGAKADGPGGGLNALNG